MLGRFIGISLVMTVFAGAAAVLALHVHWSMGRGAGEDQLWSIFHMLLDVFPDNLVGPFLDGNSMQIILMGVFMGGALLVLGKQASAVCTIVEQLNSIVHFLMELVTKLVPGFIFVVVVQMFWTSSLDAITQSWRAILIFGLVAVCLSAFVLIRVARHNRVSLLLLMKKCAQTFVVALTTASSTASFGTAMECCEKKLGVDGHLTRFGLSLGMVFYPPVTAAYFLIIGIYVAGIYQLEISLSWILMGVIVSVILAIASPPIPGGTLFCYTVLFLQLGIPQEGLVAAMALDVIFDFLATALNMVLLEMELTQQAAGIGALDQETLKKA